MGGAEPRAATLAPIFTFVARFRARLGVALMLGALYRSLCFHVHHLPLRARCVQLRPGKCALRFSALTLRFGVSDARIIIVLGHDVLLIFEPRMLVETLD